LRTGPSLFAAQGNLLPDPTPANVAITSAAVSAGTLTVHGTHGLPPGNWASDPVGDAKFPIVPVASANHPALDIVETSLSDNGSNLTVTMKMADLSPAALADAASTGGVPTWMVVWWEGKNGLGPAGMTSEPLHSHFFVKWLGQNEFVYGKLSSVDFAALGAPTPKALTYVPSGTATAIVNGNTVTMTVPLASVGPLANGDKLDHVTAYSLVEHADATVNDWADQVESFSYIVGTPAGAQHFPDGYVQVSTNNFASSTIATLNSANNTWTASLASGNSGTVCARQVLAKDLYTPVWDDVQAGPVSCANFSVPTPTGAVSRKMHGPAGNFDINLPLIGSPGIECRSGGDAGIYQVVVTFAGPVSVGSASVTSGAGSVSSATVNLNQVFVNLSGITNPQTIAITLTNVNDGSHTGNVIIPMSVLVGDTTASKDVNSSDVSQTKAQSGRATNLGNFRTDVTANGVINASDVSLVKARSGTSLP
jgi:hypothetical protein